MNTNNNISDKHRKDLGYDLPENYFEKSKLEILSKIKEEAKPEVKVFTLKPIMKYAIAASIVLAIGLFSTINFFDSEQQIIGIELASLDSEDYDIINSLFVDENDLSTFMDNYLEENIVAQATNDEILLDEFLMDALLMDDTLINDYSDHTIYKDILL